MNKSTLELLADYAEKAIAVSMAQIAGSIAPTVDRVAGEIDMAYKLKLIDYPRRDVLRSQLRVIVNNRRVELREQQNARMLRTA
jgi:S-methylmethionine-dependent homocysteine/selenocysteine methylase